MKSIGIDESKKVPKKKGNNGIKKEPKRMTDKRHLNYNSDKNGKKRFKVNGSKKELKIRTKRAEEKSVIIEHKQDIPSLTNSNNPITNPKDSISFKEVKCNERQNKEVIEKITKKYYKVLGSRVEQWEKELNRKLRLKEMEEILEGAESAGEISYESLSDY